MWERHLRHTKIVCTSVPRASPPKVVLALTGSGDGCGLGSTFLTDARRPRPAPCRGPCRGASMGRHLAVLQDLQGPKSGWAVSQGVGHPSGGEPHDR